MRILKQMSTPHWTSRKRLFSTSSLLTITVLALAACGGDEDRAREGAAITITTEIDFSSEPFHGTFSVDEGEEALGCANGTFVDTPVDDGVNKEMTCEEGTRQGSFTIFFQPMGEEAGRPWSVASATGDFSGLEGDGEFSVEVSDDESSGVETLTGEMNY